MTTCKGRLILRSLMTNGSVTTNGSLDAADAQVQVLQVVAAVVEELHPGQAAAVTLDARIDRELGLDSLARVELIARTERVFGVALPEQVFATIETPRDLLRAVTAATSAKPASAPSFVPRPAPVKAAVAPSDLDTLTAILDWHVATHPDRPHIRLYSDTDEGELITYRDLRRGAEHVAAGLQGMNLRIGEAVTLMLPTGVDYFLCFFGVLLAGGVPVPIYPPTRPSQIAEHLRRHAKVVANCGAGLLITQADAKAVSRLLKSRVESLRAVVTPDDLITAGQGSPAAPHLRTQDIALLQYTSGSTGQPKGVVLTHANLLANIRAMAEAMEATSEDVFVSWLPLYHDMGLIGAWLGSLVYATPLIIMSPLAFLARPQRWLWAIHRYGGTMSAAPNFGYELCLRRLNKADLAGLDLGSWRVACNGAEPVSPTTVERFCEHFGEYGFRRQAMMPVYGLAEASVGLAFPPMGRGPVIDAVERDKFMRSGAAIEAANTDPNAIRFVACGRPLPGHEIRVVDPAGRELPERQEGRLQFRGPSACTGYFRNAVETRQLFDGMWLNSGDLAYIAGGDVYLTGRSKDIIIRAGRNIYPDEFEEAVGGLDGVRKGAVAIFASSDAQTGTERLVVVAETRRRDPATQERLRTQINELAVALVGSPPDEIVLAPPRTVLKTSSGKIRRAASREAYEQDLIGKAPPAFWWQLAHFALSGTVPQLRRSWRSLVNAAYATYAWCIVVMATPPLWLGVAVLPTMWRWWFCRAGLRLMAWATGTSLSVEGLANLPPPDQTCTFVSNHASYLDGFALATLVPRQVAFVAKAELAAPWSTGVPLRRLGALFVERFDKRRGIEDARHVAEIVGAKRSPHFFAEGTFTRMPGLLPFHMGAFVAAAEKNTPVVPIAIRGTRSILRSGSWFPRRGSITVAIGPPIMPNTLRAAVRGDQWALALKLRDQTRAYIQRHCGEPDLSHERPPLWIGVPPPVSQ